VLLATTAVTFMCSAGFLSTEIGRQALVDQWERSASALGSVDDATYAQMEDTVERFRLAYAGVTALASGPALAFALATLLWLLLNRTTRRHASYVEVLAIVCYAGIILTLRQVIATPIDYMRETIASPTTLIRFFPMLDEVSPVARFLGAIDLFVIWWIAVLAIGVSVLYQRRARSLALVFTGTYLVLALLLALAMAASGGVA